MLQTELPIQDLVKRAGVLTALLDALLGVEGGGSSSSLVLNVVWGADNKSYREHIRQHLWQQPYSFLNNPLDLTEVPKLKGGASVSISHTKGLGGYLYHPARLIGLDLEVESRVNQEVVDRVRPEGEGCFSVKNPSLLWCARESLFKALQNSANPGPFSSIVIREFVKAGSLDLLRYKGSIIPAESDSLVWITDELYLFKAQAGALLFKGFALNFSTFTLALAGLDSRV